MKKIIKLFVCIGICIGMISNVNARESQADYGVFYLTENYIEIELSEELKEIAKENNMKVRSFKRTEQKLNVQNTNDTTEHEILSVENLFIDDNSTIQPMASGSIYEEDDIVFYSVTLYGTIYYDRKYMDGENHLKLTKVSGGIKNFNSGFALEKQTILIGAFGSFSGSPFSQYSTERTTTSKTWTYSDFNFPYVSENASHDIGCVITATITHGTGSGSSKYTGSLQVKHSNI